MSFWQLILHFAGFVMPAKQGDSKEARHHQCHKAAHGKAQIAVDPCFDWRTEQA